MNMGTSAGLFTVLPVLMLLVYVTLLGLGIYALILFFKLAHRGIKALDIYLDEKGRR